MTDVLIGCKLPHGLVLELIEEGYGITPAPTGKRVVLKGANSLRIAQVAQGEHPFAITRVEKSFWEEWLARNHDFPFIKNGLVFVAENEKDAKAMAKERMPERTGLEALNATDLKKDPRFKSTVGPSQVEADPEALATAMRASGNA